MPTTNVQVTKTWSKIAEASTAELLATWDDRVDLEFATTAADSAPTVRGHRLSRECAITRIVLGAGYVWVRVVPSGHGDAALLVVSK